MIWPRRTVNARIAKRRPRSVMTVRAAPLTRAGITSASRLAPMRHAPVPPCHGEATRLCALRQEAEARPNDHEERALRPAPCHIVMTSGVNHRERQTTQETKETKEDKQCSDP